MKQSFEQKIENLKAVENDIPAVIVVVNMETLAVAYMCKKGQDILKVTMDELAALGSDYHSRFFNPEDYPDYAPLIMNLLTGAEEGKMVTFFQQVRATENDNWKWYHSSVKVFLRNDEGVPTHVITYACPVDSTQNIDKKADRLLEEHQFLKQKYDLFNELTKREREILKYMAKDTSSVEIAKILSISEHTVNTHRTNIRRKLSINTQFEITQFAQAFALI